MQAEQCVRMELDGVCELGRYCLELPASPEYELLVAAARASYTADGVATLPGFLGPAAIKTAVKEVERAAGREWFTRSTHNVFLDSGSPTFLPDHIRNRQLPTQVGLALALQKLVDTLTLLRFTYLEFNFLVASLAYDLLDPAGPLLSLYHSEAFTKFLARVLGLPALHRLADPLGAASINIFPPGTAHNWHFDEGHVIYIEVMD